MKTLARSACVAVLLVLTVGGTVTSAPAKGPTDVAVEGPGVDRHLTYTAGPDVDAGTLSEVTRLHEMLWETGRLAPPPELTPDELGPRYVLTWSAGDGDVVVQHAYPFAEGGAWVEFPPDQSLWGTKVPAGWAPAPALRKALVALGAVADPPQPARAQPEPSVTAADAPAQTPADQDDAWLTYRVVVPAGVLLAGAVVAGLLIARRRQLSR